MSEPAPESLSNQVSGLYDQALNTVTELATLFSGRILAAIAILFVGWIVARLIRNTTRRLTLKAKHIDDALSSFVTSVVYSVCWVFILLAVLGTLGVQTTAFITVMGAAGLAVGLALQGSLSNLASGLLIIIQRPFKAGDFVDFNGCSGVIRDIDLLTTTLTTPDNRILIVPNSQVTGNTIENFTREPKRRVDFTFGVAYASDIDHVKRVVLDEFSKDERIHPDPAPMIRLKEMADSSLDFTARVWTDTANYWSLYFDMMEGIKKRFDAEGIEIPFPQRDVHMRTG